MYSSLKHTIQIVHHKTASIRTTRIRTFSILWFTLVMLFSGCTTVHPILPNQNLSIKTPSLIVEQNRRTHLVRNLEVNEKSISAESLTKTEQLTLDRQEVKEIRETNHIRGMYRVAASAASAGLSFGLFLGVLNPSLLLEFSSSTSASFGLFGGLVGYTLGHTNVYRFMDESQLPSSPPPLYSPSSYRIRNKYYLGLELRNVRGNTPLSDRILSFEHLSAVSGYSASFEGGISVNQHTLLGIRFSPIEFNALTQTTETMETYADIMMVTTFFPKKSGHFIRVGIGGTDFRANYWRGNS